MVEAVVLVASAAADIDGERGKEENAGRGQGWMKNALAKYHTISKPKSAKALTVNLTIIVCAGTCFGS